MFCSELVPLSALVGLSFAVGVSRFQGVRQSTSVEECLPCQRKETAGFRALRSVGLRENKRVPVLLFKWNWIHSRQQEVRMTAYHVEAMLSGEHQKPAEFQSDIEIRIVPAHQWNRNPHLSAKGFSIFHALGSHDAPPGMIEKLGIVNRSRESSCSSMIALMLIALSRILGNGKRSRAVRWIVSC